MYYVVYGFLYVLSLLPLRVLFVLSDFVYFLIYHVFGYRRKVVFSNLDLAFPNKTPEEKKAIAKRFYHNLTDSFVETIKLFSADRKFIDKHVTGNYEVVNALYDEGMRCQIHLGHNFNWELGNLAVSLHFKHKYIVVYMPLENKTFNRIFYKMRSRFNAALVSAKNMKGDMMAHRNNLYALGLVADQTPANAASGYWVNFFNQPTSFVRAPERGAMTGNIPVVFLNISKRKRGYYHLQFELGEKFPASLQKGELTKRYVQFLEKTITQNPDVWLWSHRRWKLKWKEGDGAVL
jgi:Kdo2-lipid IVA lauroyltransferase/acyltransferase